MIGKHVFKQLPPSPHQPKEGGACGKQKMKEALLFSLPEWIIPKMSELSSPPESILSNQKGS